MFKFAAPGIMAPKEKTITRDERDAAKAAAKQATPRVYTLTGLKSHQGKLRFVAFGCQGSANEAQADVGKAINEFIRAHQDKEPDFILLLGDNLYPKGVKSPRSSEFEKSFQTPYAPLIKQKIPFFIIPGNHDYNMRDEAKFIPASQEGKDLILNEVAYTYLPDGKRTTEDIVALFKSDTLDLKNLPAWNMPTRYYAIDAGDTRIICLDSSTYIAEYLIKDQPGQTPENNQARWLAKVTTEAKQNEKQCMLAMHHPTYSPGRRAFKNDLSLYLNKDQRNTIREAFSAFDKSSTPYNIYLKACLEEQGLQYDLILTAHDHNQYYYNDGEVRQLTAGGGGGRTQPRAEFANQANLGCFFKDYGYSVVKTPLENPEKIDFSIRPLRSSPLFFSNDSVTAKRKQGVDEKIITLITATEEAVEEYFAFIATKQTADRKNFLLKNLAHGKSEIKCAHQAWALINQKEIGDYASLVKDLYNMVKKTMPMFGQEAEHAFSRILNKKISEKFQGANTLEDLFKDEDSKKRPQKP
jgi:hypothetical protein